MLNSSVVSEKEPVSDWGGRGRSALPCGQGGQGTHSSAIVLARKGGKGLRIGEETETIPDHRQAMSLGSKTNWAGVEGAFVQH